MPAHCARSESDRDGRFHWCNVADVMTPEPIDLWVVFQDEIDDVVLLREYDALLSESERLKGARFYFEKHRKQHLITRALVRTVLSSYRGVGAADWQFATDDYGRPHVVAPDVLGTLSFNLAHTDGLIVCACTAASIVGVDAERVRIDRAPLDVADRYFSPAEVAELRALPRAEQPERFFQYWTLKESYIKATGKGLSTPLDQFSFRLARRGEIELSFDAELNDDAQRWRSWLLEPAPGYLVALTVERGPGQVIARKVVPLRSTEPLEYRIVAQSA
jgi:4'-phosphopantetheinyl transferase